MTVAAPTDRPKSVRNRCVFNILYRLCVTLTIHCLSVKLFSYDWARSLPLSLYI